jgi:quercetin dioxygenase-like cupin family protein
MSTKKTGPKKVAAKKMSPAHSASNFVCRKIKSNRIKKQLSFEQMANETGFAVDYLKNIEDGKVTPPVGALLQISKALQIDSASLMKEQEPSFKDRIRAYTIRTENYAYETLTPGAENKHLKAFRVTIEAGQDHKGVGYLHEGEEFNYVLKGKIQVTVGDHVNILKAGESLYFNSAIRHQLKNIGDEKVEMIVAIYSP